MYIVHVNVSMLWPTVEVRRQPCRVDSLLHSLHVFEGQNSGLRLMQQALNLLSYLTGPETVTFWTMCQWSLWWSLQSQSTKSYCVVCLWWSPSIPSSTLIFFSSQTFYCFWDPNFFISLKVIPQMELTSSVSTHKHLFKALVIAADWPNPGILDWRGNDIHCVFSKNFCLESSFSFLFLSMTF